MNITAEGIGALLLILIGLFVGALVFAWVVVLPAIELLFVTGYLG